jgi:hypothetical protein
MAPVDFVDFTPCQEIPQRKDKSFEGRLGREGGMDPHCLGVLNKIKECPKH